MTLLRHVAVRSLLILPTLFILLTFTFFVLRVLPSDPVAAIVGPHATKEAYNEMRSRLGLDQPIHIQYFSYFANIIQGDLGKSILTGRPVTSEIAGYFPASLELAICGIFLAVLIGILTGALSAVKHDSIIDHIIRTLTLIAYSIPVFWLGLLYQLFFGVELGILPIYGRVDILMEPQRVTGLYLLDSVLTLNVRSFVSSFTHLILPTLCIGIAISAIISRITRGNMIEALYQDYVLIARAKGLSETDIIYKYVLRNAIIPTITVIGMQFAAVLGGVILTETVFSLPGLGRLLVERIYFRDFPVIQGCVIFFGIFVSVINLIVDIMYSLLDPRIGY